MTRKDELIIGILKKELKTIKNLLKEQERQIKDISKNGFDSEIHPAWHLDIGTGLSYTSGYCTGHIVLAERVMGLLKLSDAKDVEALLEKNRKIEAANKKYMDDVLSDIKKRVKNKKPKRKLLSHPLSNTKVEKKMETVFRGLKKKKTTRQPIEKLFGAWKKKKISLSEIREKNWNRKKKK